MSASRHSIPKIAGHPAAPPSRTTLCPVASMTGVRVDNCRVGLFVNPRRIPAGPIRHSSGVLQIEPVQIGSRCPAPLPVAGCSNATEVTAMWRRFGITPPGCFELCMNDSPVAVLVESGALVELSMVAQNPDGWISGLRVVSSGHRCRRLVSAFSPTAPGIRLPSGGVRAESSIRPRHCWSKHPRIIRVDDQRRSPVERIVGVYGIP